MLNLPKTLSSEEVIVTFFKNKLLMSGSQIHCLRNFSILSGPTDHSYTTLCLWEEDMQPLIKITGEVLKHPMIGSDGYHQNYISITD